MGLGMGGLCVVESTGAAERGVSYEGRSLEGAG
jgi:hypothetical protein